MFLLTDSLKLCLIKILLSTYCVFYLDYFMSTDLLQPRAVTLNRQISGRNYRNRAVTCSAACSFILSATIITAKADYHGTGRKTNQNTKHTIMFTLHNNCSRYCIVI